MVCLNHPDVNATAKCAACGKPLCSECVMIFNGQNYCSEACHLKGAASSTRADDVINRKKKTESSSAVKKFVIFLIILAIAAGAAYFYSTNKKTIDKHTSKSLKTLKVKAEQAKTKAENAVEAGKKAVPANSKYKQHREGLVNGK